MAGFPQGRTWLPCPGGRSGSFPCRRPWPQWHGPLQFLSRAERLESGWWDEGEQGGAGDVQRDYFVARNPQGQWAWVFRATDGWYLHGLFA